MSDKSPLVLSVILKAMRPIFPAENKVWKRSAPSKNEHALRSNIHVIKKSALICVFSMILIPIDNSWHTKRI